jgi:non-homologous end joining protein Ku
MKKANNTLPLIEKKTGNPLTRKFLGELFPKNVFESNELKAYVAGKNSFNYGKDESGNPVSYPVRQEYSYKQPQP